MQYILTRRSKLKLQHIRCIAQQHFFHCKVIYRAEQAIEDSVYFLKINLYWEVKQLPYCADASANQLRVVTTMQLVTCSLKTLGMSWWQACSQRSGLTGFLRIWLTAIKILSQPTETTHSTQQICFKLCRGFFCLLLTIKNLNWISQKSINTGHQTKLALT